MGELHRLTIRAAARRLRAGDFTPAELDADVRAAIAAHDGRLHCYSWLAEHVADLATARAAADRAAADPLAPHAPEAPVTGSPPPAGALPLWGIPGALKANLVSRGQPSDCGSRLLAPYRSPYDASVVERLRAAGAHFLGKTNMDEFAMGSSTEHSAGGPTRNPWHADRIPSGSSGGSAAAVAADLAFFALGSDTGGSVRQPAHCCGVVGLKPTYGRVSRHGLVAFASSLDQIGPLTKDVADGALVYAALAGPDRRDATCLDAPVGDPCGAVERSGRGLTVGVPWSLLATGLDPDVASDFRSTLDDLRGAGVAVVEVALPTVPYALAAYCIISTAEASSNLARYDGVRYGARVDADRLADLYAATRTAGFGDEVKLRILLGTYVLSAGYYDAYYRKAVEVRGLMRADFARAFTACDAIALPTAPTAAFPLGARTSDPLQMYLSDVFTVPANLTGLPAISVPTGLDRDGLPLSLQLIAPALAEERLFTLAAEVERTRGFRARKEAPWNSTR